MGSLILLTHAKTNTALNSPRGRSQTTLTRFWIFLTTYPPALTFSMVWTLTKSGHFWTTYLPRLINVVCEQTLKSVNPLQFFSQLFGVIKFVKGNAWVLTFCIYLFSLFEISKNHKNRQNFFINKKLCVIESWWWDSWSSHKTLPWLISSSLISQLFLSFC